MGITSRQRFPRLLITLCLVTFGIPLSSQEDKTKCHQACHPTVPGKINAHIIAHTHDDVGWLKTVDQYYYGSKKEHSQLGVQYILDSVTSELAKNKDRRFVYVETSFFWRWWEEQNEHVRVSVKELVDQGRLEFLLGGWCMSDEASPHYSALIDQMTLGLKYLNDTFGECGQPKVAWQIDPFGHSAEVALEFADMGFDGVFFGRIDHEDIALRKKNKTMEMVWRPDDTLGPEGDFFTGVMYNIYDPPAGFCFDTYCDDEPIMDNPKLHGVNVNTRVSEFIEIVKKYAQAYKTNNVIITMGGDFNYVVASSWFKNIDKLIKYVNAKPNSEVNVLYSTPACYLEALNKENITWPSKMDDDFFPYGSDEHSYWTGYYTSRPTFKYFVYQVNVALQMTKQLKTALPNDTLAEEQFLLQRAMGIAQHHDAVSGTERQHVTDDYSLYLYEGVQAAMKVINAAYRHLLGDYLPEQQACLLMNISQCELPSPTTNYVILYNPVAHETSSYVVLPVPFGSYKVFGPAGNEVETELLPIQSSVLTIPGRQSNATHSLIFNATGLPPLGANLYLIEKTTAVPTVTQAKTVAKNEDIVVDNGKIKLIFNGTTGLLEKIVKNGVASKFKQNFYYYEGAKGYNYNPLNRASGAYIFRPSKDEKIAVNETAEIKVYQGKNVTEVHQVFTTWLSQTIRVYNNDEDIEFIWQVGPIPIVEWQGKEIVTVYDTDIANNSTFFTDSNGRRWMKRLRNYRSSWNWTATEPIAANYYPITTGVYIADKKQRLNVIVDRPEGASSMRNGSVEIMIHRRLLYDDNKGVREPLDEIAFSQGLVARGTHIIQFVDVRHAAKKYRLRNVRNVYRPWLTVSKADVPNSAEFKISAKSNTFSLLKKPLPNNVHILTLEQWTNSTVLARFEHIFDKKEDPALSSSVPLFSIRDLFTHLNPLKMDELVLSGNKLRSTVSSKLKWRYEGQNLTALNVTKAEEWAPESLGVKLKPMEIKTYLLHVEN
uniref:Alpha-mannosidase n=2 Tax=Cacopsylla melanoneura TaxID=428564 RepID=A0A8D8LJC1_9HEMI